MTCLSSRSVVIIATTGAAAESLLLPSSSLLRFPQTTQFDDVQLDASRDAPVHLKLSKPIPSHQYNRVVALSQRRTTELCIQRESPPNAHLRM